MVGFFPCSLAAYSVISPGTGSTQLVAIGQEAENIADADAVPFGGHQIRRLRRQNIRFGADNAGILAGKHIADQGFRSKQGDQASWSGGLICRSPPRLPV